MFTFKWQITFPGTFGLPQIMLMCGCWDTFLCSYHYFSTTAQPNSKLLTVLERATQVFFLDSCCFRMGGTAFPTAPPIGEPCFYIRNNASSLLYIQSAINTCVQKLAFECMRLQLLVFLLLSTLYFIINNLFCVSLSIFFVVSFVVWCFANLSVNLILIIRSFLLYFIFENASLAVWQCVCVIDILSCWYGFWIVDLSARLTCRYDLCLSCTALNCTVNSC